MFRMSALDGLRERLDDALPPGSLRARLAKGAFWATLGVAIAQGLAFAASVLVVRRFGRELSGEFAMIRSTVGALAALAQLSLGLLATRYVAECRTSDPARAGRVIALSTTVAGVSGAFAALTMLATAPWVATRAIGAAHLTGDLRIASALLLIEAAIGAQLGTLAGLEAFRAIFWVNLLRGALTLPALVAGAYLWNLRGAVIALVVIAAAAWVINEFAVRRELRRAGLTPRWDGARRELPLLWSFALPASLTGLMTGPAVWAASAMLVRQPDGLAALGMFSAADVLRSLVLAVGAPLHAVLLPMLSSREGRASSRVQRVNVLATWMLGLLVAVPAVCFPGVVGWVFGRKFAGVEFNHTIVLVVVAAALASYRQAFGRVLAARDFMWWGVLNALLRVVALLGAMLAARYHGSIGMAMATAVSLAVPTLVFVPFYVRRGLIPRELVWSWETLWIWVGLAGAAAADFLDPPIVARLVVLLALAALVLVMTRRLFRRMRETESEAD